MDKKISNISYHPYDISSYLYLKKKNTEHLYAFQVHILPALSWSFHRLATYHTQYSKNKKIKNLFICFSLAFSSFNH